MTNVNQDGNKVSKQDVYVIWTIYEQDSDAPKQFRIVNRLINRVHTVWKDLYTARQVCRDLNLMFKEGSKVSK